MPEIVQLSLLFLAAFAVAAGLTAIVSAVGRHRTAGLVPPENAGLRIRASSGMYRSRFLGAGPSGWTFAAPIQRDAYVPIRVGEQLTIEASSANGMLLFQTEVIERDADTHQVTVAPPHRVSRIERRQARRFPEYKGVSALLDGRAATLCDLSEYGARLETDAEVRAGERVELRLDGAREPIVGWVLEATPQGRGRLIARIRFEDPVPR